MKNKLEKREKILVLAGIIPTLMVLMLMVMFYIKTKFSSALHMIIFIAVLDIILFICLFKEAQEASRLSRETKGKK